MHNVRERPTKSEALGWALERPEREFLEKKFLSWQQKQNTEALLQISKGGEFYCEDPKEGNSRCNVM